MDQDEKLARMLEYPVIDSHFDTFAELVAHANGESNVVMDIPALPEDQFKAYTAAARLRQHFWHGSWRNRGNGETLN